MGPPGKQAAASRSSIRRQTGVLQQTTRAGPAPASLRIIPVGHPLASASGIAMKITMAKIGSFLLDVVFALLGIILAVVFEWIRCWAYISYRTAY